MISWIQLPHTVSSARWCTSLPQWSDPETTVWRHHIISWYIVISTNPRRMVVSWLTEQNSLNWTNELKLISKTAIRSDYQANVCLVFCSSCMFPEHPALILDTVMIYMYVTRQQKHVKPQEIFLGRLYYLLLWVILQISEQDWFMAIWELL